MIEKSFLALADTANTQSKKESTNFSGSDNDGPTFSDELQKAEGRASVEIRGNETTAPVRTPNQNYSDDHQPLKPATTELSSENSQDGAIDVGSGIVNGTPLISQQFVDVVPLINPLLPDKTLMKQSPLPDSTIVSGNGIQMTTEDLEGSAFESELLNVSEADDVTVLAIDPMFENTGGLNPLSVVTDNGSLSSNFLTKSSMGLETTDLSLSKNPLANAVEVEIHKLNNGSNSVINNIANNSGNNNSILTIGSLNDPSTTSTQAFTQQLTQALASQSMGSVPKDSFKGLTGDMSSFIRESTEPVTASPLLSSVLSGSPSDKTQLSVVIPFQQKQWGEAVSEKVVWMSGKGIQEAEIRLDPPELGPLHVKISIENDQAHVSFTVQHSSVKEALDQQANRLREMFAEEGIDLVDVDVSEQSQQQAEQQDSDQQQYADMKQGNPQSANQENTGTSDIDRHEIDVNQFGYRTNAGIDAYV